MPIHKYFKGDGSKVMKSMKKEYGTKKGKQVFYATAHKMDLMPSDEAKKRMFGRKSKV